MYYSRKFGREGRRTCLISSIFMVILTLALLFTGCGNAGQTETEASKPGTEASKPGTEASEPETIRVGSLKGPTSMGILYLMEKAQAGQTEDSYEFQMAVGADELLPLMVKGELDICLVPANVASQLYHKTEGGVSIIDINTLGVLCLVTGDEQITQMADLRGRTIYLTGKGTTPEAILRYLLEKNGMEADCRLEFKSEAAEVAAILSEDAQAVGFLPQPFATAAMMQNDSLRMVLDINQQWQESGAENSMSQTGPVTGVTMVRNEFLQQYPESVKRFLTEHAESAEQIRQNPEEGAKLTVKAGIVGKEAVAQRAIPKCSITCITGEEMKAAVQSYLKILTEFDEKLTGGEPGEDFYFLD